METHVSRRCVAIMFDLNTLEGNLNLIAMGAPCRRLTDKVMECFGLFQESPTFRYFTCPKCGLKHGTRTKEKKGRWFCRQCNAELVEDLGQEDLGQEMEEDK